MAKNEIKNFSTLYNLLAKGLVYVCVCGQVKMWKKRVVREHIQESKILGW